MRRHALVGALFAVPVLAQANAVPGLDILMYDLTDIAVQGRRGPAWPNGETGFMVGHSWCNSGTVNLPWQSVSGAGLMVDQYPRIAFLLARESGGRMVQITGQGHSKHSPTAFNFQTGPCLPCNVGSGSFFFVGCSDTYGSGINSSQFVLGPNHELNPWLGTWNPQGSYFDRGDPPVSGAAAIDSVRSLTSSQVAAFDSIKNKMIVRDSELVAGAVYYAQVQAVVQGEPLGERDNNISNRQCSISGTGASVTATTAGPQQAGSVLTRWSGATTTMGGNGTDDGRFVVAVKVTGPVAGMWHYEYAVHNVDNHRGGASFRLPLGAGAVVQNVGFRDVDADPLNEWTFTQSSNELSFTAVGTNALDWNTIYNCWFDCSIPPGAGSITIDQARPGTGALAVQIPTQAPSGLAFAYKTPVGSSCGTCQGSFYEFFTNSGLFDLAGRSMTMSLANGAYTVADGNVAFVPAAGQNLGMTFNQLAVVNLPFSLPYPGGGATTQLQISSSGYVSPTSNASQLVPSISTFLQGNPRWAALWTALGPTLTGGNVFYDANPTRAIVTWNGVSMIAGGGPSTFQIQFFPSGTVNVVWQNVAASSFGTMVGWTPGGSHLDPGSSNLSSTLSTPQTLCAVPFDGLALDASASPVLGTTVQWQLAGVAPGTGFGALMRSLTQATPPIDLAPIGMPGCFAHVVAPVATVFLSPGSTVQIGEPIPNVTSLIGVTLVGQAITYNPAYSPLGFVASNGMVLSLGM